MILTVRRILITILNIIGGTIAFFIGLRIIFNLFAANPNTPFVAWVMRVSQSFVYPFQGIIPNLNLNGGGVIDIVAIVAMIAYLILLSLVIALVDGIANSTLRRHYQEHQHIT